MPFVFLGVIWFHVSVFPSECVTVWPSDPIESAEPRVAASESVFTSVTRLHVKPSGLIKLSTFN